MIKNMIKRQDPQYAMLKIIPHHSTLNSTSRKIQSSLFELFSVKPSQFPWQHKQGLFIALQPAPAFWWMLEMYALPGEGEEEDQKHVEFYVAMPEGFVDSFKTKFRNHDQWGKSTLEEVAADKFDFPTDENTDLYALKYKRHDMFSLGFRYDEQTTPIRDLMTVSSELKAGEKINLFIRTESVDRGKWKKLADYAWEQWGNGHVPTRAGFDPLRIIRNIYRLISTILFEVKSLGDDFMLALQRSFYPKTVEDNPKASRQEWNDPEREELLINGDLSATTKNKRNLPVFKTSIRFAVHSNDPVRRGMLGRSVANAYSELNGDNRLEPIKITIRTKKEMEDLRNWKIDELKPNLMSVDELGKLEQLPTSEIQKEFHDVLESNQKVEIEIPKVFLDESGIFVGTAKVRNEVHKIHIPTSNMDTLMTSRAFMGSPRQGKDQGLINLIVESKRKHGIGAVIPDWIDERKLDKDGHQRGLSDAIRDSLPPEDVIDIDLTDYEWAVYLGLQNIMSGLQSSRIAADEISKVVTNFLMGKDTGDLHTTREYLRDAAKVCKGDWINIKRIFTDADFRDEKIKEMEETFIGDYDLWRSFHEDLSDAQRANIFTPINVRLGEIMNDEVLKPILCQKPNHKVDITQWIKEGKIIIFRMKLNKHTAQIMAHYIVMMVYLIKRQLDGEGAPTWLPINEPHQVETPAFTEFLNKIFVEGPKYRLAPVVAFHHLGKGHLSKQLIDTLASANLSWHLFYNSNVQTYQKLQEYIEPTFSPDTAMKSTQQFHFIAAGWRDLEGTVQPPFMVKAPDRVKDRWGSQDNSFLTKRHSREYGRPVHEILSDFRNRNSRQRKKAVNETEPPPVPAEDKKTLPKHVFYKK